MPAEISVGGQKIIGGGPWHTITMSSGFSATARSYKVVNGICNVVFARLACSSTGTNKTVCTGLPKPAYYVYQLSTDAYGAAVMFLSMDGGTTLYANVNNTNQAYISFSYPVADDWYEPAS